MWSTEITFPLPPEKCFMYVKYPIFPFSPFVPEKQPCIDVCQFCHIDNFQQWHSTREREERERERAFMVQPSVTAVSEFKNIFVWLFGADWKSLHESSYPECVNFQSAPNNEPRHENICLRGFRPGKTQTGLLSYKKLARALKFRM